MKTVTSVHFLQPLIATHSLHLEFNTMELPKGLAWLEKITAF